MATTDLRALKPSQTRMIARQLEAGEGIEDFLTSLRNFLAHSSELGHSGDTLYATARELSAAGVWPHINATDLQRVLRATEAGVRARFISGLPHYHRAQVEHHLEKDDVNAFESAERSLWLTPLSHRRASNSYDCIRLSFPAGTASHHMASAKKLRLLDINEKHFCEVYNSKTTGLRRGTPTAVVVSRDDDCLSFVIHVINRPHSSRAKGSTFKVKSQVIRRTEQLRLGDTLSDDKRSEPRPHVP